MSYLLESSRKRRNPEQCPPGRSLHQSKRLNPGQPASAFWDNLSFIPLTKDALKELDRRTSPSSSAVRQHHTPHRPLTRQFQATLSAHSQTLATYPLDKYTPESQREIKRHSRQGGLDLYELRNFPAPRTTSFYPSTSPSVSSDSSSDIGANMASVKAARATPYNQNFQQHLVDHGIYGQGYEYPDGQVPAKPNNLEEIHKILTQPRSSLSPSNFSESDFQKFVRADVNARKEKQVTNSIVPVIEGDINDPQSVGEDYVFRNLAPLTDGTIASAKPDHFFGARPEQLHPQIRDVLNDLIIPSMQKDLPMAPNFFLEAKGPDGPPAIAARQACYDGALGARAIHSLQSYKQDDFIHDGNAYTITSTYQHGQLRLYANHLIAPRKVDGRPEYIMTPLRSFSMIDSLGTFLHGASAYRNARDWAKEQRDKFINIANERHMQEACSTLPSGLAIIKSQLL